VSFAHIIRSAERLKADSAVGYRLSTACSTLERLCFFVDDFKVKLQQALLPYLK